MDTNQKKPQLYLFLILLIGLLVRLFQLGNRPFDGDEGVMVKIAQNNWPDLFQRASFDVHPPFYHSLLKLFISFGIDEWSVRMLSALAGILAIYVVYIFTKKIMDEKLALIASFLAAISPYLIYSSQEARMYSLFLLLSLLSYYFFYNLLKSRELKFVIGYIIIALLCLYTHYLGFILIGSQILYLVIFDRENILKNWKSWLVSYASIILLFLPQLPTMISQFSARLVEKSQALSLGANLKGLFGAYYRFGAGRLFLDISPENIQSLISSNSFLFVLFLLTLIIPVILLILGLYSFYKTNKEKMYFMLLPMILAVILAIVSTEVGSRSTRYLIYIYPFYLVFVSFGIINYWKNWWGKILAVLFIFISLTGLYAHYSRDVKAPGENKIARFLSTNYQKGDIIVLNGAFGGGEEWALNYYLGKQQSAIKEYKIYDLLGNYKAGNLSELNSIKPQEKINQFLKDYHRVWFYDLSYETKDIKDSNKHYIGKDKEQKEIIIYEVSK